MMKSLLLVVSLALTFLGCEPHDVPSTPSWDQDVFPILQGSCGHCHGSSIGSPQVKAPPTTRFDMCWTQHIAEAQVPLPVSPGLFGAAALTGTWFDPQAGQLNVPKGRSRPRMPPPPASPLSDYQTQVLAKWAARVAALPKPAAGELHLACVKQTRNREPRALVLERALNDEGDLVVTLEVSDPDHDQVVGKVEASGVPPQSITATGRKVYVFEGATLDTQLKVTLHDGFVARPVDLNL